MQTAYGPVSPTRQALSATPDGPVTRRAFRSHSTRLPVMYRGNGRAPAAAASDGTEMARWPAWLLAYTQRVPVSRLPPGPRVPPATRCLRAARRLTTAHAFATPFPGFWPRPAIMRHDPGLAASPWVRYRLKVEGSSCLPSRLNRSAPLGPVADRARVRFRDGVCLAGYVAAWRCPGVHGTPGTFVHVIEYPQPVFLA